jgi:hypothetical protein
LLSLSILSFSSFTFWLNSSSSELSDSKKIIIVFLTHYQINHKSFYSLADFHSTMPIISRQTNCVENQIIYFINNYDITTWCWSELQSYKLISIPYISEASVSMQFRRIIKLICFETQNVKFKPSLSSFFLALRLRHWNIFFMMTI